MMRGKGEPAGVDDTWEAGVDDTWNDGITAELGPPTPVVAAPVETEIKVGQVLLGRYVLEAELGSGGMGTVYRAEDRVRREHGQMNGRVALKIAHAGPNTPASTLDKLRHEFYCAQALSHPSIVKVYELEGTDQLAFFTMEFLDGERLSDLMKRWPKGLLRPQAWLLIREICEGLAHAHSRSVVHGDLKPQNVMVLKAGGLRILDFGAASLESVGSGGAAFTPSYASCQLLAGEEADRRDDVFALACIAYELLTGEHPFQRRRANEARDAGMSPKEPQNLSQGQWQALQQGLAWESRDRPGSVQEWLMKLVLSAAPRSKGPPDAQAEAVDAHKVGVFAKRWISALVLPLALIAVWAVVHFLPNKPSAAASAASAASAAAPAVVAQEDQLAPIALPSEADLKEHEDKMTDIEESAPVVVAAPKVRRVVAAAKPAGPVIEKIAFVEKAVSLGAGAKFAEIHVYRSASISDKTNFVWWTEAGSATPGVDFLPQGHSRVYFSGHNRMTTLFVKLVPNSKRNRPQVFYLNIADASNGAAIGPASRLAITLLPRGA